MPSFKSAPPIAPGESETTAFSWCSGDLSAATLNVGQHLNITAKQPGAFSPGRKDSAALVPPVRKQAPQQWQHFFLASAA